MHHQPVILALDTTRELGSLALLRGLDVMDEVLMHAPTGFAHVLYAELSRLLERHSLPISAIDCFAAASGPGSFTGVRVGLACIKGLAEALQKPAIGVSNLQAIATFASGNLRAAVIDARRGDIYGALYDSSLQPVTVEVVTKLPLWLDSLPQENVVFVSTEFTAFAGSLTGRTQVTAPPALAAAIGRLAAVRHQAGEPGDPAAIDANYVRRSDAELFWKEA